jgi:hypothetical protein
MKKLIFLIGSIALLSAFIGDNVDNSQNIPNNAYSDGEKLSYLMYYGWLDGGTASLSINKSNIDGRNVLHAVAVAKTSGLADKLYNVNDTYESYIDENTGKPIMAIRNIAEKKYRFYDEVTFLHTQNKVKSKRNGLQDVPKNIFDLVSAFYYARRALFSSAHVGDTIAFTTYFDDKIYPIKVRFLGKEKIETKAGKFNALKFRPIVQTGRIFDTPDDMTFWVSNDQNFVPLRIEFDLFVGSLKCDLVQYSGLKSQLARIGKL